MTKKKYSRSKHQKDVSLGDTSEEEFSTVNIQGKSCPHVTRGIHFGRVKKSLKSTQNIVTCNGCSNENTNEELPEVWLCLQCGYRGCGRMSENKHGLQHFKTLHSDCHSLVLSTSSGSVWCYDCDDEISLQSSCILKQCVEFIMKMVPSDANTSNASNVNKSFVQKSLQNSVIKEETSLQNAEEIAPVEKIDKSVKSKENSQKIPTKGLRNLGNTCFFNAVMQNLNQTPLLYHHLKNTCTPSHLWQVPELSITNNEIAESDSANIVKLSLPRQFPLTNSLLNFFEQLSAVSSSKVDIVNPTQLFGEISRKCPQFRHFQQQDSHELLRQLLDGVRQEEIKRQKKAILRYFDLENVSPENVDEEMKKQIKAYGCYASHTIIEKVFGGLLISTVLCEECKASSQVFEPFMDLSLPLFEEKQQENNEQLYGMLDGGKQDHIKPLRIRKIDCDDDNVQGDSVLNKPKNDLGKPSKHQEKKQKQLAKKEKKRSKNIARNRKNSLNEHSPNNQLNEAKNDDEEETNKDSEEPGDVDNQNEDTWDVPELFGADEENSKDDPESTLQISNSNIQVYVEKSNNLDTAAATDIEKLQFDIDSLVSHPEVTEVKNVEQSSELQDEDKHEDNENLNHSVESEIVDDPLATVNQEHNKDESAVIQNKKTEGIADVFNKPPIEESEDIAIESAENQSDVNEIEKGGAESEVEKTEEIADDVPNPDDSLCSLTEDFSHHLKLDSSQSNMDDRIQALSMQVKDVRIRRDSDRQENLLNSSESADDCESQITNCTSPKSSIEDSCSVENGDNWSHSVSEQQTKDWISKTLTTLKPRHLLPPLECSVNSCLSHFTKPELLTGNNKFRCENCTQLKIKKTGNKKDVVYSNASKQMLIFSPPAILTLHLKRFQQVGMSLRKVNRFVEFSLVLDLSPYCCSACSILPHMSFVEDEILYSLYGIVEHSGRLTSGHYTAYVKANKNTVNRTFECQLPLAQCDLEQLLHKFSGANKDSSQNSSEQTKEDCQWFYISDSHVKEVSEAQVLKCQAYLLFYERIK